ncbi:MAG: ABC transporter ATP-binding protein [Firmicutes bacterium]|nr:ABC transporter ATP-binding protein [Bacillota bacterium]
MRLIELQHITMTYQSGGRLHQSEVRAVRDVTLHIEQGECLALVGESGSGKSTLGRIAVGLEKPTEGRVLFKGHILDARKVDRQDRQALQMVYQNSFEAANPRFTASQVVEEPIRYFRLAPKNEWNQRILELLGRVGIPKDEAEKKTTEFSGGQLQRICIARALAARPELILLDEPLSSLDVSVQAQILNLLRHLKEEFGLTYLLISHDLETVYNIADRLAVMYAGRIVEEIDDIELFDSLRHPYTALLLGKDTDVEQKPAAEDKAVAGESDAAADDETGEIDATADDRTEGCVYANRCPYAEKRCFELVPELTEFEQGHRIACHHCR